MRTLNTKKQQFEQVVFLDFCKITAFTAAEKLLKYYIPENRAQTHLPNFTDRNSPNETKQIHCFLLLAL